MMKIIAAAVVLLALIAGAGAGYVLKPPPTEEELAAKAEADAHAEANQTLAAPEVVSLRDHFVVPVLRDGRIWSHVVLSLGVETHTASREEVLIREPLLRDGLNESLFLHASLGGFEGDFTAAANMNRLRARLNGVVTSLLDDGDARVLIISMARQNG